MQKQTLQEQMKEINNSTLHNMRFLLESYTNQVLAAIDKQNTTQEENKDDAEEAESKSDDEDKPAEDEKNK